MTENNTKFTNIQLIVGIVVLVIILVVAFLESPTTEQSQNLQEQNKIDQEIAEQEVDWEQSNTGLTTLSVNTITADVSNQSILYAGTNTGVFKSIDKGESWTAVNNGLPNPLPNIGKIIHAPFSKAIFALSGSDLFESLDGGNNWVLRAVSVDDIALKPNSTDAGFGEKIYILKNVIASQIFKGDPTIYSISTGIGFFSEPQQETRMEINSFYERLYKDQDEINKNNREKASELLGKTAKDDDISHDVVKVTKIDFLRKEEKKLPSGILNVGERIISLLSQNSWPVWLLTNENIYFCTLEYQICEKDEDLQVILKKEKIRSNDGATITYSQVGVPHIYINPSSLDGSGKLLIKTCLNRRGSWIMNNSLSDLGFLPTNFFIYSHNRSIGGSSECDNETEKEKYKIEERTILEDIIFAVVKDKGYVNFLLVSKDNAETWTMFKGNLPTVIESVFATEVGSGYNIYITTKDNGIFKTSISLEDLK